MATLPCRDLACVEAIFADLNWNDGISEHKARAATDVEKNGLVRKRGPANQRLSSNFEFFPIAVSKIQSERTGLVTRLSGGMSKVKVLDLHELGLPVCSQTLVLIPDSQGSKTGGMRDQS